METNESNCMMQLSRPPLISPVPTAETNEQKEEVGVIKIFKHKRITLLCWDSDLCGSLLLQLLLLLPLRRSFLGLLKSISKVKINYDSQGKGLHLWKHLQEQQQTEDFFSFFHSLASVCFSDFSQRQNLTEIPLKGLKRRPSLLIGFRVSQ